MKIIEVIADAGHLDTLQGIAEQYEVSDIWHGAVNEDGRMSVTLLLSDENRQVVLDSIQSLIQASENAKIIVTPVEAVLPKAVEKPEDRKEPAKKPRRSVTREEIYSAVEVNAQLHRDYLLLVMLSSIVASAGLLENNVAVIIGAMVIAPLLGPNIAFAFGTSLGDRELVLNSLTTIVTGIALAISVAFITGLIWPAQAITHELVLRTDINYAGTAIALASGAAASLSLVTGLSSVLVGVMVAVALMPPAVTIGLMLSDAAYDYAIGASMLLAVNIVCINLSAKLVFLLKGIQPRTWLETKKARQSRTLYLMVWITLLMLLIVMIYLRHKTVAS
ncbi:MAG: TIGR00341 family protein [Gammaproteobacteria bacterium]